MRNIMVPGYPSTKIQFTGEIASKVIILIVVFFLSTFLFSHIFSGGVPSNNGRNPLKQLEGYSFAYYQIGAPGDISGSGIPIRLKIPSIGVDAYVVNVGLTPGGVMDMPENQDEAAWFELGSRPGSSGSAVIAGHYGLKDNKPSAFDNLHKLRKGDTVIVENDMGASVSFVVRESRRYDPKQDASDVFGSSDGKSHLNLVTCEGVWDLLLQQYPKRLVVFTDRE